jgi:hypothetical protein
MVVGDKVRVIALIRNHGLEIGYEGSIVEIDKPTIKVKGPDGLKWWLWEGEYELLNQE